MTTFGSSTGEVLRHRRRPFHVSQGFLYAGLVVITLLYIFPFILQVLTMFKTEVDATNNPLSLIPAPWTTDAIIKLFLNSNFPLWFMNSTIVTICVTLGRAIFDSMAGYALARLHFKGRNIVFAGMVAVMSVPAAALLIPKFLVLNSLGIYNTYAGMILPLLVDATGVFIMKGFFESIPSAIEESARIDGAGVFRTFWSIVLPMARPALVTIIILSFQGSWNELAHFVVASQSPALFTLTKGVASLASGALGAAKQYPLKLAAATVMTIPVVIIFFIFQKRIMNTGEGAVKE